MSLLILKFSALFILIVLLPYKSFSIKESRVEVYLKTGVARQDVSQKIFESRLHLAPSMDGEGKNSPASFMSAISCWFA